MLLGKVSEEDELNIKKQLKLKMLGLEKLGFNIENLIIIYDNIIAQKIKEIVKNKTKILIFEYLYINKKNNSEKFLNKLNNLEEKFAQTVELRGYDK